MIFKDMMSLSESSKGTATSNLNKFFKLLKVLEIFGCGGQI